MKTREQWVRELRELLTETKEYVNDNFQIPNNGRGVKSKSEVSWRKLQGKCASKYKFSGILAFVAGVMMLWAAELQVEYAVLASIVGFSILALSVGLFVSAKSFENTIKNEGGWTGRPGRYS
ncbi:hypothetical protein OSJ77_16355 [Phyllobacterium sp. 0TCS1.6C]|uniref:hypothetical protein n=1 Tax=unclassified Phyllobacterium TaxID=2638441 RepID=UPI00226539EB|nr:MULTISPECIES: hypothetical protein [unclassified Phyllobacterium]MCX8281767.1 hypothetical protein [Phyllobacterium sp. 0TCS1.6C]MCX8295302.1 hypothetical protein [Phyllobacterium sp. 0TCS1.6A]